MSKTLLQGKQVLIGDQVIPASIEIQNGKILKIHRGIVTGKAGEFAEVWNI